MWERGYRHNPFSLRYQYYLDHRPNLPQDDTWSFLRSSYDYYQLIYYKFNVGSNRFVYLLSNNIPVAERERLKVYYSGCERVLKNMKYFAFIPTIFLYQFALSFRLPKYRLTNLSFLVASYIFSVSTLQFFIQEHLDSNLNYFLYKYNNLTKENILEIEDPRRKFFRLDTNQYYRQSANEILHHGHHDDSHSGGHHHDTSNYFGPHPVSSFLTLV